MFCWELRRSLISGAVFFFIYIYIYVYTHVCFCHGIFETSGWYVPRRACPQHTDVIVDKLPPVCRSSQQKISDTLPPIGCSSTKRCCLPYVGPPVYSSGTLKCIKCPGIREYIYIYRERCVCRFFELTRCH